MPDTIDVAVLGAGPYGLSVAAHLPSSVRSFRVFGTPMETWVKNMPEGMFLKSEGLASNIGDPESKLTLARFCSEAGRGYAPEGFPIPLETFVAYGRWFQEHAVASLEDVQVTRLCRNGVFTLELESGEAVEARRVVVATGVPRFAYMPSELSGVDPGRVLHTSEVATFERFAGEEVAIVGAGQSALELAALLLEHGARPTLIVRGPTVAWNPRWVDAARSLRARMRAPATPLGNGWKLWACSNLMPVIRLLPSDQRAQVVRKILPPAGAGWLRDRVEPAVPLHLDTRVVRTSDAGGRLRLTLETRGDEQEVVVDRVVAGTGYRVAIDRLEFLAPELRDDIEIVNGAPRLSAHFESRTVPGLYFVGLAAAQTFGPAMRFVCGTAFAGRTVARHVRSSDHLRRRTREPVAVAS